MDRISSTSLGTYLSCERKLWEGFSGSKHSHPTQTNEQMAFGTVFHGLAEFRTNRGRWPSLSEFDRLKGNYDDPVVARKAFPGVYEPALETAMWVEANHPNMFELPEGGVVEQAVGDWGLTFDSGVRAEGFIDLFLPEQQKIVDWKTRGGFHYVPRTAKDFHADAQLCYYGAAAAFANGWDKVTVEHRNVLRPDAGGPQLLVVEVELPVYYLRGVWQYLNDTVVPGMAAVLAEPDRLKVERRLEACFEKGPCPHLKYCYPSYDEEANDPFNLMHGLEPPPDPFALLHQVK